MRKRNIGLAILTLISITLLSGCSYSFRLGYVGSNQSHRMSGRYVTYHGSNSKNISLTATDTLEIKYNVDLSKGSLTLTLLDPAGDVLWEEEFSGKHRNTVRISTNTEGKHKLNLTANGAGGKHEVSWLVTQ